MGITLKNVKIIIYVLNVVLVFIGIAILIVGANGMNTFGKEPSLRDLSSNNLHFVVFGIATAILGLLAFWATAKESLCFLLTYGITLLLLSGVELAIGLIALTHLDEVQSHVKKKFQAIFAAYYANNDIRNYVDDLQTNFKCCGFSDQQSWNVDDFPASCCANGMHCSMDSSDLYAKSCGVEMYESSGYYVTVVALIFILIGFFQILCAIMALYLRRVLVQIRSRGRVLS